jgi:hypothetical protein
VSGTPPLLPVRQACVHACVRPCLPPPPPTSLSPPRTEAPPCRPDRAANRRYERVFPEKALHHPSSPFQSSPTPPRPHPPPFPRAARIRKAVHWRKRGRRTTVLDCTALQLQLQLHCPWAAGGRLYRPWRRDCGSGGRSRCRADFSSESAGGFFTVLLDGWVEKVWRRYWSGAEAGDGRQYLMSQVTLSYAS